MKAIQFVANEENGVINVPTEYAGKLGEELQVIILIREKKLKKSSKKSLPRSLQISTQDLVFDRDEANER